MNKTIKTSLFVIWLAISLSIVGFSFMTWEYWFVMIPTVVLVVFFNSKI